MSFKQKHFQSARTFASRRALGAALCVSCIGLGGVLPRQVPSAVAQGFPVGPNAQPATVRLLAAPGRAGTTYEAGVEIAMVAGAHTYWKMPGDSGVPPVFDFDGSENVSAASVSFPAPTRISEEGFDAFGYTGRVVYPVAVTPLDRAKPARLRVDVTYAVCDKICVPGHADATLTLAPGGSGVAGDLVAAALAQVPKPLAEVDRGKLAIAPVAAGKAAGASSSGASSWTLTWTGAEPLVDIFPDAPEGFVFDTRKVDAGHWTLTASQGVGAGASVKVPVSLVLKAGEGGYTVTETLDVRPSTQ